ncbi:MAG: hypothetical protein FJ388_02165 [Verrucomicrobia bacterium]|nr:hypothetical protein [Verrucomicrobiota bacterium]
MKRWISRREFVRGASAASGAAVVLGAGRQLGAAETVQASPKGSLPMGRIGKQEFSRLMLGGNLVSGYAHARDLKYVADLTRRYNTEAKILETLEAAESHGINCINLAIWDDLSFLKKHWQRGGKMKLIAQAIVTENGSLTQFQKAVDFGASAVHMQGHGSESLLEQSRVDLIGKTVDFLKKQGIAAGVAAHALSAIEECKAAGINPDFYQKTLHTVNYPSAPRPEEKGFLGSWDNGWCRDPYEVMKFMAGVKKPWIAFKVMAAGAIHPKQAFPFAFNAGADFILAGMFDWQIAEDVQIAKHSLANVKRARPWFS